MPHDIRDSIIDFVRYWSEATGLPVKKFIDWLQIQSSKYYNWKARYGKANEHNGLVPRDFWLDAWEKQAIISYRHKFPDEGYRRLTFMMLDNDIVAVSPSSTYRVLSAAGLLQKWNRKKSKKGNGFRQPLGIHEHWHIDVSYINICGTFYYICSILDGCSRYIVHWELRESMTEQDIEIILQRARERFPDKKPRVISDNGPQFVAKDFKEYIRIAGMTHVRTSPYYPQSNGKIERWHGTLKRECIRPGVLLNLDDARRVVGDYIHHYNHVRLNSAIGYIAPIDKLNGRAEEILKERDLKLELARQVRKEKRTRIVRGNNPPTKPQYPPTCVHLGPILGHRALTGLPRGRRQVKIVERRNPLTQLGAFSISKRGNTVKTKIITFRCSHTLRLFPVLLSFEAVAGGAVGRTEDHVNLVVIMFEGIPMLIDAETVALSATDCDGPQFSGDIGRRNPPLQLGAGTPFSGSGPAVPARQPWGTKTGSAVRRGRPGIW